MNKVLQRVAALLVLLLALGFAPLTALGDSFNIIQYFATGGDGDWWQYEYTYLPVSTSNPGFSPAFKVNQTLLPSGIFSNGPWILPDKTTTDFGQADATNLYLYDFSGTLQATVNGVIEIDSFIDSPFPGNTGMKAYFGIQPSMDVIAGTFTDILIYVVLDMAFTENKANITYHNLIGMPLGSGWGVTHISGMVRGLGKIVNIDFEAADPEGTRLWQYQLAAYSVQTPIPATLLLLGSGLCSLIFFNGRKWTGKN